MDGQDVDKYFVAKRKHAVASYVGAFAVALFAVAVALYLFGVRGPILVGVLVGSVVGTQVVQIVVSETRKVLLEIVERQINRSPEALAYLAEKSKHEPRVA